MKAPIQIRKFSVSFGDSISFLSMVSGYTLGTQVDSLRGWMKAQQVCCQGAVVELVVVAHPGFGLSGALLT